MLDEISLHSIKHFLIKFNPIKLLKYVIRNQINKRMFIRIIQEKKDYLLPGNYMLNHNGLRIAALNDQKTLQFIERNTRNVLRDCSYKVKLLKKRVRIIMNYSFSVKVTGDMYKNFEGSLVMITGKGNIKIFDFRKGVIITFFNKRNEYQKRRRTYHHFMRYFKIPKTKFINNETAHMDSYIEFLPFENWSISQKDDTILSVLSDYYCYFSLTKKDISHGITPFEFLEETSFINNIKLKEMLIKLVPKCYYQEKLPITVLHGDLNFKNLLLSDDVCYYIDWEFSRPLVFFYDFINLIFVEAMNHNNYYFIEKYLRGHYNSQLQKIFSVFDLEFHIDNKLLYISIYLMECIRAKDLILDSKDIPWEEENYLATCKKLVRIKESITGMGIE